MEYLGRFKYEGTDIANGVFGAMVATGRALGVACVM